jgi:hypothetical protein
MLSFPRLWVGRGYQSVSSLQDRIIRNGDVLPTMDSHQHIEKKSLYRYQGKYKTDKDIIEVSQQVRHRIYGV